MKKVMFDLIYMKRKAFKYAREEYPNALSITEHESNYKDQKVILDIKIKEDEILRIAYEFSNKGD